MCGIAGYFGEEKILSDRIDECLNLMNRRGPDNAAHKEWVNSNGRNIYLLHTRLSIIDLDPRANQPYNIGDKWIVLNGELYNYLERREELIEDGIDFVTNSDTEVLLRSIDHFGWDILDRCEGMWAFAVYNETEGSLTLCRDRFGEKPLYIYQDKTGFYFGSEVKFIMALLGRKLEINLNHLLCYLVNGYKSLYKDDETFFKGLKELPRANLLKISSTGTKSQSTYWELKYCPDNEMTYQEAIDGVQERLIKAVEIRLRADVPLAFCMSGGVDSNALISIAKNIFGYDVHGFTIVNTDERYEEQDLVEYAVDNLNIHHSSIPVNTDKFIEKLRLLVNQHDAPIYTITYYAHWLLMQSIAEHGYRISVSGTAADELFTGYYDHHLMYLNEVKNNNELYLRSKKSWTEHIKPIVRNPFLNNPELFIQNQDFRDHIYLEADEFRKSLLVDWCENFTETEYCDSLLRNRMMNELFHESVPLILHEDDLNAMFFSIENRSPFLDRHLAEFCYRIPSQHLIRDGIAKAVLRDAMRGIVPDKILDNRRKVGFNAPIFSFLDVHDPNIRNLILEKSPIYDYINLEKIEELLNKPFLENSESKFLFYFINCKLFMEEFT